jgi:hypothetical protein
MIKARNGRRVIAFVKVLSQNLRKGMLTRIMENLSQDTSLQAEILNMEWEW